MSYAFTGRAESIVTAALLNKNFISFTVVNANAVNGGEKQRNNNGVTQLRSYYYI